MGFFSKLFKIAQSKAHTAVDNLEDPIQLTEQGIRDLKGKLKEAMVSLAQVKSSAIRLERDCEEESSTAADYERKAMLLLQRAQSGEIAADEGDRLATAALEKQAGASERAASLRNDWQKQESMSNDLQSKINKLQDQIRSYENELVTLRARHRTAQSMKKINQTMNTIDASSTVSMLERMRDKVKEQEALAEAYGEINEGTKGVDAEIDKALGPGAAPVSDSLLEMKKRLGITAGDKKA